MNQYINFYCICPFYPTRKFIIFILVWTHEYLFYIQDYNLVLHYIFFGCCSDDSSFGYWVCLCVFSHSVVSNLLWLHDCSPPGSSVHGFLQTRILEWVVISYSRRSSWSSFSWFLYPRGIKLYPHKILILLALFYHMILYYHVFPALIVGSVISLKSPCSFDWRLV